MDALQFHLNHRVQTLEFCDSHFKGGDVDLLALAAALCGLAVAFHFVDFLDHEGLLDERRAAGWPTLLGGCGAWFAWRGEGLG